MISSGGNHDVAASTQHNSLTIVKEALHLNIDDGLTWLCLGNTLLYDAFRADNQDQIEQVMKAYTKAEDKGITNAELYINKSALLSYLAKYPAVSVLMTALGHH